MLEMAGLAVSGINLLLNAQKTVKDWASWKEADVEVDGHWLGAALEKGLVTGDPSDFGWMALRLLPTAELRGTHTAVVATNDEKRIRYRIVQGPVHDRLVLVKKVSK